MKISLSPAQSRAAEALRQSIDVASACLLRAGSGAGRTTVLRAFAVETNAAFVSCRDLLDTLLLRSPSEIEEAFLLTTERVLSAADLVVWDDLHLIRHITNDYGYPRRFVLDLVLSVLLNRWRDTKKFVFGFTCQDIPWVLRHRSEVVEITALKLEDYVSICSRYLSPQTLRKIDFSQIFRRASALNCYQLANACRCLGNNGTANTDSFLEYLTSKNMTTNVDLEEVAPVSWKDLKGMDELIEQLETKVALPFESDKLASELDLKPKRGVLLAGPPGTGKTSIGRALAHRLKGKFFLVDGTVVAGSSDFYEDVEKIFDAAKNNAPSVIFVDDADVIFEKGNDDFYRYLLTMLDGLATASAQRVCVMVTAMEPRNLPPALLRSGRIELWLETKLPDADARAAIFREKLLGLPAPLAGTDITELAQASHGLTGADLKSAVEDGKLLYARDVTAGHVQARVEEYFLQALREIRANRVRYRRNGKSNGEPVIGYPISK